MASDDKIYVPAVPGDVISAEGWNELQERVYDDIRATSQAAAAGVTRVERAGDAEKLDGQTPDQVTDAIVARVLDQLRERQGYMKVFKVLTVGNTAKIEHRFGNCPVVDVYQLDYFRVVSSEDDGVYPAWATFYLYHSSEKKIRYPAAEDGSYPKGVLEIEPKDPPVYTIPFRVLLERYKVDYTSTSTLGDLETEFWKAFFVAPNDAFDDEQHCHSPWFHRCCREEKSVRQLKDSDDWDELRIQMRPRKTINLPGLVPPQPRPGSVLWTLPTEPPLGIGLGPAPTQVQVHQYDLDTVGIELVDMPIYLKDVLQGPNGPVDARSGGLLEQFGGGVTKELKVMVILKC
jgi:hypothetical protein